MNNKRSTIADVANRAGVSKSAVSKVLRNAYGISDQMRQSVEEAMAALQYRPQMVARGMRGSTYTLGVVMPDMRNPFFPDIIDGIWSGLKGTSYEPLFAVRHSEDNTEEALINVMLDRKLDGLILIAPNIKHTFLEQLSASTPVVVIGRHENGGTFDTVNNDDLEGAKLAVNHLIGQKHTRIAFMGFEHHEDTDVNPVVFRMRGYIEAMIDNRLSANIKVHNAISGSSDDEARQLTRDVLSSDQRPTAIFAWSDRMAITVMSVAEEMGLKLPEELAVVGYDNTQICGLSQIQLSSIDQDAHHLGRTASRLLIERIDGRVDPVDFVTQPKLIPRQSSTSQAASVHKKPSKNS